MTDKDKNPENSQYRRKNFAKKIAGWIGGRNREQARDGDLLSHTTFFDYVRPGSMDGEFMTTTYLKEKSVPHDEILPAVGETVIVTAQSEETTLDSYFVLTKEPRDKGQLPELHVDLVVLTRKEGTPASPDSRVLLDLEAKHFFEKCFVEVSDETLTPNIGTEVLKYIPSSPIERSESADIELDERIHRALTRLEYQVARHGETMHRLDRVFDALDEKKS